ncbi:MAG TPA: 3-methyl-2-oxobutanoate hydroxymethyltransferase [candidate division Zixibacteria bacterium]|nr:3-methyl-2-oxobutanoate hydroxymethyltransferase [candidate division Zixibacteria bacterium]
MSFQERIKQKKGREKVVMLTAYDFQMARILDQTGIDLILVGDSSGMVVQGYKDTKSVTMADMMFHVRAVARGAKSTPIIGDMPIGSCGTVEDCLENAKQFVEAGAHGVKIEGKKTDAIKLLIRRGIPVMGHVGMLPQLAEAFHVKGKTPMEAEEILQDAQELDGLGVFSIVLECIPESLAKTITNSVKVPTIGIGASKHCDGQVLVINDLLGFDENFKPKYVKTYANLNRTIRLAVAKFMEEVSTGAYPDDEHTYH